MGRFLWVWMALPRGWRMRFLALGLGILGAVAGFIGGLIVILIGAVGGLFAAEGTATVVLLGLAAMAASTVALFGSGLAAARPSFGAVLLGISAVVGLLAVSLAYVPAAIFLGLAAVLAFMGRRTAPRTNIRQYGPAPRDNW
jgi:hypothetical protein